MFITLEGIEGSGKTTQVQHIVAFLQGRGRDCTVTREPGGTRIGERIRAILLDPKSKDLDHTAELLLYSADRAQHIREVIRPALAAGGTVLCDRYFDATVVYQGYARGLDTSMISDLHRIVLGDLKPDVTILLDLPVKLGLSRAWKQIDAGNRDGLETRFEKEDLDFHERVRGGYLKLAGQEASRFRVIDASGDEDQVREQIAGVLSSYV